MLDTTGALDNDNAISLYCLTFWLGAGTNYTSGTLQTSWGSLTTANRAVGQVNLADSTSNEWYITGVQLEAGTSASDFEFLPRDVNQQDVKDIMQKSYDLGQHQEQQQIVELDGMDLLEIVEETQHFYHLLKQQ